MTSKRTPKTADRQQLTKPEVRNLDPLGFQDVSDVTQPFSVVHPGASGLTYYQLRAMARTPGIAAIIRTRVAQVMPFLEPRTDEWGVGFMICPADPSVAMTDGMKAKAAEVTRVLMGAGGEYGPGSMALAMSALIRDTLEVDQVNAEVLHDKGGNVSGWVPCDPAMIRRARPTAEAKSSGRWYPEPQDPSIVERDVLGRVVNEYTQSEMLWGVRNARSYLGVGKYGYPELDELCGVVTDMINAQTFNSVNFTNGIHASTIIAVAAQMDANQWTNFRRSVTAMLTGVRNAKRTPFVQLDPDRKENITAIPLGQNNKDMEYTHWVDWLFKMACAAFTIDPAEVNVLYGSEGVTSALSTGGPAERIIASKERGLYPLLCAFASWFTKWIVQPLAPDLRMKFVGFDAPSTKDRASMDVQALQNYMTLDEVRVSRGLKKLGGAVGDLILNNYAAQALMSPAVNAEPVGEGMPNADQEGGFDLPEDSFYEGEEGAADETMKGTNWNDVNDWTARIVEGIHTAVKQGKVGMDRIGKGRKSRVVPSSVPGVRAWVVEA